MRFPIAARASRVAHIKRRESLAIAVEELRRRAGWSLAFWRLPSGACVFLPHWGAMPGEQCLGVYEIT